jgi:transcriptional regulator with XRE-family HTH domain
MKEPEIIFETPLSTSRAIKQLRKSLDLTQSQMARALGAEHDDYIGWWESGRVTPGGKWIVKMLQLWPDEALAAFGIRNQESGISPAASTPPGKLPPSASTEEDDRLRQFSDAAEGLNQVYQAAQAGHPGADELLRALANELTTRGGNWRTMRYARAVTRQVKSKK